MYNIVAKYANKELLFVASQCLIHPDHLPMLNGLQRTISMLHL